MKKTLLLLIALTIVSSCEKEEPDLNPTKTELLTNGTWKGLTQENYADGLLENTFLIPDLNVNYSTDFTGTSYLNGILDNSFTWSFNSDETKLTYEYGNNEIGTNDIEVLTSISFITSSEFVNEGVTYKIVYTFEH